VKLVPSAKSPLLFPKAQTKLAESPITGLPETANLGEIMPILKNLGPNVATMKFRVYMAIFDSELAQTLLHRVRQLKKAAYLTLTNPRELARTILARFDCTKTLDIQEAVSPKPLSKKAHFATSSLPIIFIHRSNSAFIHRSNSDHLKYSLAQAHKSNPQSAVFLLGDSSNDVYDFVEHRPMTEYLRGAAEFQNIYKHYSTHTVDFELICFQRWFILREFVIVNNISQCLYLDSDTMLYADVTREWKKFEQFDFTLCWNSIGCVFFLNRLKGLDEFCQFLMDIYGSQNKFYYDRMVAHYAVRKKHQLTGGACDMTAFQFYSEGNFGQMGEASHIIDGAVYDPNINMPHPGFEMENGIKKIIWKNRQPYGKHLRTGEEIRFNSLHFNGRAKKLMSQYYTGNID